VYKGVKTPRASIGEFAEVERPGPLGADEATSLVAAFVRALASPAHRPSVIPRWTLWLTGRPGSGKTTLVSHVCGRLHTQAIAVVVLDPAELAAVVVPRNLPSPKRREMLTHALVYTAKLLNESGVAVVIDGAAPMRAGSRLARQLIACFAEVELECPPEVCRTRERGVRWNLGPRPRATRATVAPDLGLDYERPPAPDLVLHTDVLDEKTATDEILRIVDRLERNARGRRNPCA